MVTEYKTFPELLLGAQGHECHHKSFSIKNDFGATAQQSFIGFACTCGDEYRVRISNLVKKEGCLFSSMIV